MEITLETALQAGYDEICLAIKCQERLKLQRPDSTRILVAPAASRRLKWLIDEEIDAAILDALFLPD